MGWSWWLRNNDVWLWQMLRKDIRSWLQPGFGIVSLFTSGLGVRRVVWLYVDISLSGLWLLLVGC